MYRSMGGPLFLGSILRTSVVHNNKEKVNNTKCLQKVMICKSKIERENKQITVQLALTDMIQHTL